MNGASGAATSVGYFLRAAQQVPVQFQALATAAAGERETWQMYKLDPRRWCSRRRWVWKRSLGDEACVLYTLGTDAKGPAAVGR